MAHWLELSQCDPVTGVGADKHWIWDSLVVDKRKGHLLSLCETDPDKARILAAPAPHAGDWLHVIPSANCGLFLENEEARIAVGVWLGAPAVHHLQLCVWHDCEQTGAALFFLACSVWVDTLGTASSTMLSGDLFSEPRSRLVLMVWLYRSGSLMELQPWKDQMGVADSLEAY